MIVFGESFRAIIRSLLLRRHFHSVARGNRLMDWNAWMIRLHSLIEPMGITLSLPSIIHAMDKSPEDLMAGCERPRNLLLRGRPGDD